MFSGPGRLTGSARWMIQGRHPRPSVSSCPGSRPDPNASRRRRHRGVPAGVPAARLLRRDPRSASPPGGHGPVRYARRTQYRHHGDQGRPCPRLRARDAVGRLASLRKSAGPAVLVLSLRSPGPVWACCLVAGGGHLYNSRGSGGAGIRRSYDAGTLPGHDAGRCGAAAYAGPAGQGTGWAGGQRNRSHPGRPWPGIPLSVAFWKPGRADV
jgi:hypothetical protein